VRIFFRIITFTTAFLFLNTPVKAEVFAGDQDHCVAWKTKKRVFLVSSQEPVGVSCTPKVELISDSSSKKLYFRVTFDSSSFNSGEPERDEEVKKLIGDSIQLKSPSKTGDEWIAFDKNKSGKIQIELVVKGKGFPLNLSYDIENRDGKDIVKGVVKTKFSDIGIEPPSVGGGLIASVNDYLELHFIFDTSRFKNLKDLGWPFE
jgi:hypothetical protein